MGRSNGKKRKIMYIQEIETNIIINTASDISITSSRYDTAMHALNLTSDNESVSGIDEKEIKPIDFSCIKSIRRCKNAG